MHINNISTKTSLRWIVFTFVITFLVTAAFIAGYIYTSGTDLSFGGFFQWYVITFQAWFNSSDEWENKLYVPLLFFGLPIGLYIGLIYMITARHNALVLQNTILNLKSVDFLPDRIIFKFNRPQYDFVCGYSEIKRLELVIKTVLVHTKNGSYVSANEAVLNFTILNNKEFILNNTPVNIMKFIYNLIDCTRYIENFSYKFSGAGEPEGMREKIEDYLKKGLKQILSTPQETTFKWMSIVFFVMGCVTIFSFKDSIPDMLGDSIIWIVLGPVLMFMGISFIFDIFLIADKIRERKFK